jgi:nucleoside-diphosphate-sugar epimerase
MARVLVTGGAGYVGSILCEHLLAAGHAVTVLDNLVHRVPSLLHLAAAPGFEFVVGDARDERILAKLIPRADVLIPLAAVVGAPACDAEPDLATSLNLGAVKSLDRLRSREQLVVYPTTNSGYGTKSGDTFCTEETPLEPISLYGRTKTDAEKLLLDAGNAVTFRLATVFGASPRMRLDLMVNHFVFKAVTDKAIVIFEKDFKRNFLHVRDAADAFLYAIANGPKMAGKPYNVGRDEDNMSKWELAQKIKAQIPEFYVHAAEIGTDPDKRNYVVSNQRLREAGFVAKRSVEGGIRELTYAFRMLQGGPLRNA